MRTSAMILAILLGGCGDGEPASGGQGDVPAPAADFGVVAPLLDENPDPGIVEVNLTAQVATIEYVTGQPTEAWTYNGSIPGPLIEAKLGDTLIVHFRNELPEATTIHWHGVRVPAEMDGTVAMQNPIEPGETFDYQFEVIDAGFFWFHPHIRSDVQVERGLYGTLRFRGENEPVAALERVLVLDDVLLAEDGSLVPAEDIEPMEMMVGRQSRRILVNGASAPSLEMRAGSLERWRIVNVANARYFRLSLAGHQLALIGTDGGLLEAPQLLDELLLVPGERADVLVVAAGAPGDSVVLQSLAYDRGHGTGDEGPLPVMTVQYSDDAPVETPALPVTLGEVAALPSPDVVRTLVLSEQGGMDMGGGHEGHGGMNMHPVFLINGEAFPDITPIATTVGATEWWDITNDTEMDHPFHLHGFSFQVLSLNGVAAPFAAWRDTVNVPAQGTLRLAVQFDDRPGRWMFHCHILEHAERGMMGELVVSE